MTRHARSPLPGPSAGGTLEGNRRSDRPAHPMTEGFSMPARWTKAREEVPRMHDNPRRQPEPLADYPVCALPETTTERILSFDDDYDEFSRKLQ